MSIRATGHTLFALLLAGCAANEMGDLENYVKRVKAREPAPIEPLPEIKQVETFVYEPNDRRSPFNRTGKSAEQALPEPSSGIAPNPLRRKEELEQYSLDAIRMVGSLNQYDTTWALAKIPDGTLFRVRAGNYLGQNHGQITLITEDRVELTEIVPDGLGGWQERQASLALSE